MKRSIAILLSALLLFNSLGYVVFYHQVRSQIRGMMRAEIALGLNSSKAEVIRVNFSDIYSGKVNFTLVEEGEFRLNGQMFDVIKKEIHTDHYLFFCIRDIKESVLEELFASLMESNSAPQKTSPAHIAIKQLIKEVAVPPLFVLPASPEQSEIFPNSDFCLTEGIKIPVKHPPDYFSS